MTAGRAGLGGPKAREGRARKFSTDPARQGVAMPNVTGHSPLFQLGGGHHHPASEASRRWPRCGFKLRSRWRLPHQPIRSREDASCYQEVGSGRGGTLRRTGVGVARRAQLTQPGGKGRGLE